MRKLGFYFRDNICIACLQEYMIRQFLSPLHYTVLSEFAFSGSNPVTLNSYSMSTVWSRLSSAALRLTSEICMHCPKYNLMICIKPEPVTAGTNEDAVHMQYACRQCVNKNCSIFRLFLAQCGPSSLFIVRLSSWNIEKLMCISRGHWIICFVQVF